MATPGSVVLVDQPIPPHPLNIPADVPTLFPLVSPLIITPAGDGLVVKNGVSIVPERLLISHCPKAIPACAELTVPLLVTFTVAAPPPLLAIVSPR